MGKKYRVEKWLNRVNLVCRSFKYTIEKKLLENKPCKVHEHRGVLIFGAGQSGLCAFTKLKELHHILGFVDNDETKHGQTIEGLTVYSPDVLKNIDFHLIFIASEYIESIQQQLIDEFHIPKSRVKSLPSYMTRPMQIGQSNDSTRAATKLLRWLCSTFNTAQIHYFLDAGTLLGVIRDGALIPWDDDLDIGIPLSEVEKVTELLQANLDSLKQLTDKYWTLTKVFSNTEYGVIKSGYLRSLKLSCEQENVLFPMVDLFVKYPNGKVADYALASRGISMPIEHFVSTEVKKFNGVNMKVPASPELYLERYYGDWKKPKKDWDIGMIKSACSFT